MRPLASWSQNRVQGGWAIHSTYFGGSTVSATGSRQRLKPITRQTLGEPREHCRMLSASGTHRTPRVAYSPPVEKVELNMQQLFGLFSCLVT